MKTEMLKGYKVSIKLKESVNPFYFESHKLYIHILSLVIANSWKMVQGILQYVSQGESKWASSIVELRKPDDNLHVCRYYKIGVNHKICSDSYPFPNTESAIDVLSVIKYFCENWSQNHLSQNPNWLILRKSQLLITVKVYLDRLECLME